MVVSKDNSKNLWQAVICDKQKAMGKEKWHKVKFEKSTKNDSIEFRKQNKKTNKKKQTKKKDKIETKFNSTNS